MLRCSKVECISAQLLSRISPTLCEADVVEIVTYVDLPAWHAALTKTVGCVHTRFAETVFGAESPEVHMERRGRDASGIRSGRIGQGDRQNG